MTDNDIIKALECCGCDNYQCDNCPYAYKTCTVYKDSLDLINRQKAEIEKLKALAENGSSEIDTNNRLVQKFAEIKSEPIKEFAERLKNKIKTECNPYGKPTFDYDTSIAIMRYIDNLVKEMVGVNTMNDNKEVKVLTHKVIRVDNLMYDGCEPHWKCTRCGKCVPFHCYTKEQFENQDCRPSFTDNSSRK